MKYVPLKLLRHLVALTLSMMTTLAVAVTFPHFFISLEGAFVEPFHEGTAYTLLNDGGFNFPDGRIVYINPTHKFAYGGSIGFFPFGVATSGQTDFAFNFFIHNRSASDAQNGAGDTVFLDATLIPASLGDFSIDIAESQVDVRANQFNITMGHAIPINHLFYAHPYVGINVTSARAKQYTTYTSPINPNDLLATVSEVLERSSITGVGPLIGTELDYKLFNSLSLMADLKFAILLGKCRFNYEVSKADIVFNNTFPPSISERLFDTRIRGRVTKGFEMFDFKFGLKYQRHLPRLFSQLELRAGYHIVKYADNMSSITLPDDEHDALFLHILENSGYHGPFVSLTLIS